MQNTILKITQMGFALVILAFGALPALAQDCSIWAGKSYWQKITPEQIQPCLDKISYVDLRDKKERTPLHKAAEWAENPKVISAMLNAGADITALDDGRNTPLHIATSFNESHEVTIVLLNAGADIYIPITEGINVEYTLIQGAARHNLNPKIITILVNAGADVNGRDTLARTPLLLAAKYNKNPEVITALLNAGAELNRRDITYKRTALHMAARYNKNPAVIMALLNGGADGKLKDGDKRTAFQLAKRNKAVRKSPAYQALKDAQF